MAARRTRPETGGGVGAEGDGRGPGPRGPTSGRETSKVEQGVSTFFRIQSSRDLPSRPPGCYTTVPTESGKRRVQIGGVGRLRRGIETRRFFGRV